MRDQNDTSVGKKIFIYFEGKKLELIKKKARPKTAVIVPAVILENSGKKKPKIIAVCNKKLFYSKAPYGGHGVKLVAADPHIITEEEFISLEKATEDEMMQFCKTVGFNYKKFRTAYEKICPRPKQKTKSEK